MNTKIYKGDGVFKNIADFMTRTERQLYNIRVWNGRAVTSEQAIDIYVGNQDFSKLDFWYSITGANTLHVNGGKVPRIGGNITVAAADVTCPGTDTGALYVYMEVLLGAHTAQIVTTASSAEPFPELGVARRVLYELHKASGSIVIDAIRITDPWLLPVFVE